MRILVVEDYGPLRGPVVTALRDEGWAVEVADGIGEVQPRRLTWRQPGQRALDGLGVWRPGCRVADAAEEVGGKRVVIGSSDSVFGFSYNPPEWKPRFLPVDETHLTRPTEGYSLSKKVTETIAESFAARHNMEVISIRPCHIIFPRGYGEIKKRGQDINNYHFWAWVDPEDVAQAFQLAINSSNYNGYEVYTVAAEDGLNEAPTLEIAQKRWGNNLEIRRPDIFKSNQFASILDTTKIKEHLGYAPKISLAKLKSKAKAYKT